MNPAQNSCFTDSGPILYFPDNRRENDSFAPSSIHPLNKNDQNELKNKVAELEKRVAELESLLPDIVVIRELSYKEAKKEIRKYFKTHHGQDITPADIEDSLGIEFELASRVCIDLEKEGQIKGV